MSSASEPYSEFADNPEPVSNGFLGPSYPYKDNIKPPNEVGITSKPGINPLIANGAGLLSYINLLLEGDGKASRTGKPLGNKFWYYTGGRCKPLTDQSGIIWKDSTDPNKDTHKEQEVNRYIFISKVF